nr:hypothetical protein Q903MT_gene1712 [Picea sitchensis]
MNPKPAKSRKKERAGGLFEVNNSSDWPNRDRTKAWRKDHHLNDWHAPGSHPPNSYSIVAMKAIQVLVPLLSSLRIDR